MLIHTNYTVSKDVIQQSIDNIQSNDFRVTINQPTGDFFYDPWVIKPQYRDTPWEILYDSLEVDNKGEARIIHLHGGTCYSSHADIDDRYHLNLSGNKCYLIDLDNQKMHLLSADGRWYNMDAGRRHAAANFGNRPRYQLVVRQLMTASKTASVPIEIISTIDKEDARFLFDDHVSPWLNRANKQGIIDDFNFDNLNNSLSFKIDQEFLQELYSIIPQGLVLNEKVCG